MGGVQLKLLWPPCVADANITFLPCSFFYLHLWSPCVIGQTIYIFILFLLSFFLLFPRLISAVRVGCLPYGIRLSVNLECRSEMCCTWLAENTGRKNDAKNRHLGTIPQLCRAMSLELRHVSTIGKKLVKQQYLLHMCPQYGELWPSSG